MHTRCEICRLLPEDGEEKEKGPKKSWKQIEEELGKIDLRRY